MAVAIAGLNNNLYMFNNDIIVTLQRTDGDVQYFTIEFINQINGNSSGQLKAYPAPNGQARLNISPIIKSTFSKPDHNSAFFNTEPYEIIARAYYVIEGGFLLYQEMTLTKFFIRAGRRNMLTNQSLSIGTALRTSPLVPVWGTFPTSSYTIGTSMYTEEATLFTQKEQMRVKGCNPLYIKFLNSLGGYSYWLFESWSNEEGNNNLGVTETFGEVQDMGNEVDFRLSVYSKVPKRYYSYMADLISSPEIYLYKMPTVILKESNNWERITSDNNRIEERVNKDVYEVKFRFTKYYNYKPAVTWSR